jgi:cytochrome b
MRGKWLQRGRQLHLWLGVFFSPLLLLFIITGWWQTFVSSDDAEKGLFNSTMARFSNIHTDDYFQRNAHSHTSGHFKILVGCMAVALIFTIVLGLLLACQTRKKFWSTAAAFILGILVPGVILYFS